MDWVFIITIVCVAIICLTLGVLIGINIGLNR